MMRFKKGNEWKVCTLEQAKRLVELGAVLETERYWIPSYVTPNIVDNYRLDNDTTGPKRLPAPDVAELGELLGNYNVLRISDTWRLYHKGYNLQVIAEFLEPKTEAQARCAALIWLIENNCLNFYQEKDERKNVY